MSDIILAEWHIFIFLIFDPSRGHRHRGIEICRGQVFAHSLEYKLSVAPGDSALDQ
jgi:hypothetical protein